MSARADRARMQVEEITEIHGPRIARPAASLLEDLDQAERAVAQCRDAVAAGADAGTFGYTADLEDARANGFADQIAAQWEQLVGEDNDDDA